MEVYSIEELEPWLRQIERLTQQVQELSAAQPDWVRLNEAIKLTGRSRSWFYDQRKAGTLPVAFLPRTEGNRCTMYSRKDYIAYGRENAILPPWYPGEPPQKQKPTRTGSGLLS